MATSADHPPIQGLERFLPVLWPLPALLIAAYFAVPSVGGLLVLPVVWIVPFTLPILAHEAAHALVARRHGLDILAFSVLPLTARRIGDRWVVHCGGLRGASGFVALAPTHMPVERFARAHRRICLAGPLANLALMPAVVVVAWWTAGALGRDVDPDVLIAGGGFVLGNVSGLLNILPLRVGGLRSDGAAFFASRDLADATAMQAMIRTGALVLAPGRPRHWPLGEVLHLRDTVLAWARGPLEREHQLSAALLLTNAYMDHGQPDDALAVALHTLGSPIASEHARNPQLHALTVFAAYLTATHRRDPATAGAMLASLPARTPLRATGAYKSTEAVLALSRGQLSAARRSAEAAREVAVKATRLFGVAAVEQDMATAVLTALDRGPVGIIPTPAGPNLAA